MVEYSPVREAAAQFPVESNLNQVEIQEVVRWFYKKTNTRNTRDSRAILLTAYTR